MGISHWVAQGNVHRLSLLLLPPVASQVLPVECKAGAHRCSKDARRQMEPVQRDESCHYLQLCISSAHSCSPITDVKPRDT